MTDTPSREALEEANRYLWPGANVIDSARMLDRFRAEGVEEARKQWSDQLCIAMIALRKIHRITSNDPAPGSDDEKDIEQIEAIAGLAIFQIEQIRRGRASGTSDDPPN